MSSTNEIEMLGERGGPMITHRRAPAGNDVNNTTRSETDDTPRDPKDRLKLLSAGFAFFVAGLNDGSIGPLIPHVVRSYGITTAIVSIIYAASFLGWLSSAMINTYLSQRLDFGALLFLGAALQALAQLLRCWPTPPFGLYAVTFWLASLGQAFQDTQGNTFVASRPKSNSTHLWLGFIHAMYMAGFFVAPFASTPVAAAKANPWYLFYTVPLGLGFVNMTLVFVAFRDTMCARPRRNSQPEEDSSPDEAPKGATDLIRDALSHGNMWLLGVFYFFYLGAVITAGGWVVEYLVQVRGGNISEMGYVSAGFGGGSLLGRILLPEPTYRFGEKIMVLIYCVLCLALQLLFWLVPNIIAASVAISFFGFFSAPFFATGMSVATRILPARIKTTALSFIFVFAQIGGSLFPIVTGLLGAYVGVSVMQPILVGLITATGVSWWFVPQPKSRAY